MIALDTGLEGHLQALEFLAASKRRMCDLRSTGMRYLLLSCPSPLNE